MNAMKLEDKLFHAVNPNLCFFGENDYFLATFNETKKRLQGIFEDGLIMCRRDLITKYGRYSTYAPNYNGYDCVSLSRHTTTRDNDSFYAGDVINNENAWIDYPFNYPAFVFEQSLLNTNPENKHSVRIPLELQAFNSISIKKAIAISIPGDKVVIPFFKNYIEYEEAILDYESVPYKYEILKYIILLMEKYSIDLPIICVDNGIFYKENKEYDEMIKKHINNKEYQKILTR